MTKLWSKARSLFSQDAFAQHIHEFFAEHTLTHKTWNTGPLLKLLPDFHVIEVAPGIRGNFWTYISSGARRITINKNSRLEFLLIAEVQTSRMIELLAITTYYHAHSEHRLGLGDTLPLGEPWLPGSSCDHFLLSHPYLFGPDLEIWQESSSHGHLLWLLPITQAERDFKVHYSLEALQQKFEQSQVSYWSPNRKSVV